MSVKYSTSPILRLRIAESATLHCCAACYCLLLMIALAHIACVGYLWLACSIAAVVLALWTVSPRQCLPGSVLCWQAGRWTLEDGVQCCELRLLRAHCLPWLTYVQWQQCNGARSRAWLFNDAGDPAQLRRLRVRLQLERGI